MIPPENICRETRLSGGDATLSLNHATSKMTRLRIFRIADDRTINAHLPVMGLEGGWRYRRLSSRDGLRRLRGCEIARVRLASRLWTSA
jgi:hypothetical protein